MELTITLPKPHQRQIDFIDHPAKRKVVRAGRRSGKTVGVGIYSVEKFLDGHRVLYAAPTADQLARYWTTVKAALTDPIKHGVFTKNETEHYIEKPNTENRIRAKTAWNADTLRGDYADILILDEYQLMSEDTWGVVGAPMLLDNNGDAVFIYTPPSLHSRSVSKASDPQHAAKLFKMAQKNQGRWAVFHFTSMENPYISAEALSEITEDMTSLAYRMEIMAEDVDEAPGALWSRSIIENGRVLHKPEDLARVVVGVDPSATSTGDEAGIVTAGVMDGELYVIADDSIQASPLGWATAAVKAYHRHNADAIIAESNNGGEMVRQTIHTVDKTVKVQLVHASRGKATRAEPVSSIYEKGRGHHVGHFPALEDEMCIWIPGDASPNRMDALVWAASMLLQRGELKKARSYQG